jgi:hypothetical protein
LSAAFDFSSWLWILFPVPNGAMTYLEISRVFITIDIFVLLEEFIPLAAGPGLS